MGGCRRRHEDASIYPIHLAQGRSLKLKLTAFWLAWQPAAAAFLSLIPYVNQGTRCPWLFTEGVRDLNSGPRAFVAGQSHLPSPCFLYFYLNFLTVHQVTHLHLRLLEREIIILLKTSLKRDLKCRLEKVPTMAGRK